MANHTTDAVWVKLTPEAPCLISVGDLHSFDLQTPLFHQDQVIGGGHHGSSARNPIEPEIKTAYIP